MRGLERCNFVNGGFEGWRKQKFVLPPFFLQTQQSYGNTVEELDVRNIRIRYT